MERRSKKLTKKIYLLLTIFVLLVIFFIFFQFREQQKKSSSEKKVEDDYVMNTESSDEEQQKKSISEIKIEDYYVTNPGDPDNLFYIDENNVLWGCGENECGQLGQGSQDYDFHEEMVKIAENVIHVDYTQLGTVIYLTKDHELYGMGNDGTGMLRQLESFSEESLVNKEFYSISTPVLIMQNVSYAKCGRDDVVVIDMEGNVWTWGLIWYKNRGNYDYQKEPVKLMENVMLVTGGLYNHAALKTDGSVWTWGYNYSGNCGIKDKDVVSEPEKVAENVVMVWTGDLEENVNCQNIHELGEEFENKLENTIIQKEDKSYWICGAGVGNQEKVIPVYYETVDYSMICTEEFQPYDMKK